jgi:hypothetical protein
MIFFPLSRHSILKTGRVLARVPRLANFIFRAPFIASPLFAPTNYLFNRGTFLSTEIQNDKAETERALFFAF